MPKVSVIIPVYGVEQYIERCARSLFEQTLDDIEYIFVNDCTKDKSFDILHDVLQEYPNRIEQTKFISHSSNLGLPFARQTGLKNATGDFIAHCDSDDWLDVHMYKDMYDFAISENADCVICDSYSHNGSNVLNVMKGCYSTNKFQLQKDLLFQNVSWAVWNKIFKKEIYDNVKFFPKDNMGEDMVITMQLVYYCSNIVYIDKPLYYYFLNTNSIARKNTTECILKKYSQFKNNYLIVNDFYQNTPEYKKLDKAFVWLRYSVKSILYYPSAECIAKWKTTFPFVEFRVLLFEDVSLLRKRLCIGAIIRNYLLWWHLG